MCSGGPCCLGCQDMSRVSGRVLVFEEAYSICRGMGEGSRFHLSPRWNDASALRGPKVTDRLRGDQKVSVAMVAHPGHSDTVSPPLRQAPTQQQHRGQRNQALTWLDPKLKKKKCSLSLPQAYPTSRSRPCTPGLSLPKDRIHQYRQKEKSKC